LIQKQAGSFFGTQDRELLLSLCTLRACVRQPKKAKEREEDAAQGAPAELVRASHPTQK
jgi:hypothetical protein